MNFKVPGIISSVIFVLIFFINIIVRNSFFVIFTRSLISAALTFGITFGIIFLFKNVLNVEWSNEILDSSDSISNNKGQSVDILAGENDTTDISSYDDSTDLDDDDNIGELKSVDDLDDDNIGELEAIDDDKVSDNISSDSISDASIGSDNQIGKEDMGVEDLEFIEDGEDVPLIPGADEELLDNNANEDNNTTIKDTGISSDEFVDLMKEKIGQDATSKETAKAIRTMLNKK